MEIQRIHRTLLTGIYDILTVDSPEYGKFIEHMKVYVRKGILGQKKNLLDKFDLMETTGHLKPGRYEALKKISESSGNVDILEMIKEAESRIKQHEDVTSEGMCQDDKGPAKKLKLDINALRNDLVQKYLKYYTKTELIPWKPEEVQVDIDNVYTTLHMKRIVKRTIKVVNEEEENPQTKNSVEKLKLKERRNTDKRKVNKHIDKEMSNKVKQTKKEKPQPISSFHELFFYNNKRYKQVLVSAESGVGKTTLCRKMISLWCKQSDDNPETEPSVASDKTKEFIHVTDENQNTNVKNSEAVQFNFLFYVSLRHAKEEEYIEEMIVKQLRIKEADLEHILDTTDCLVIVDGLDEWSPQAGVYYGPMDIKGCPKEKCGGRFYTMYTTRPWKLVDEAKAANKLELQYHLKGTQTYKEMVTLYAQQIKEYKEFSPEQFLNDVGEKTLISSTPLLLKLLMLLYAESGELEKSVCRMYGRIVELLIRSGMERNNSDLQFKRYVEDFPVCENSVPVVFGKPGEFFYFSKCFYPIKQVAKMSFEMLLKGSHLLCDTDVPVYAKTSNTDLNFLKKLGLFSQSPHIGGSFIDRESKVTFIHASFQEFYAAVHIVTNPEDCYRKLKAKWSQKDPERSNAKAVVLSDVFKFVSGMDPCAMPKMYKLIYMYAFIESSADNQTMHLCHTDTSGKFKDYLSKRYDCITKQNLSCNTCNNHYLSYSSQSPMDIPLKLFNEKILANVNESLNCGHSDFKIHITDLCVCFHGYCPTLWTWEMLKMYEYLNFINPSSLESLVLQYNVQDENNEPIAFCEENEHTVELYNMLRDLSDRSQLCLLNSWLGECSNLMKVRLSNITLTDEQMERFLLIHPSKLETIVLVKVRRVTQSRVCDSLSLSPNQISRHFHSNTPNQINVKHSEISQSKQSEAAVSCQEIKLSPAFCYLQQLTLKDIDGVLTHSQITHMLTDSHKLESVSLNNVHCEKDMDCGCEKTVSDEENLVTFCDKISSTSFVKKLDIKNCSGVSVHIKEYPQLENFTLDGDRDIFKRVPEMVSLKKVCFKGRKVDSAYFSLLRTSSCLEEVMFHKTWPSDEEPFDPCGVGGGCNISQCLLLEFLEHVSKSDCNEKVKFIELDEVILFREDAKGDADCVHQTVEKMENLQIQAFTKWKWTYAIIKDWGEDDYDIVAYPELVETSSEASDIVSMSIVQRKVK